MKIAFVGYDTRSLKISQQSLEKSGHTDFSYSLNMETFLSRRDNKPDLLFIDFNNDEVPDFTVIKTVKDLSPQTQVIALLNRNNLKLAQQAVKNGALDYILKGITEYWQIQDIMAEMEEKKITTESVKKPAFSFLNKIGKIGIPLRWKFIFNNH